MQKKDKFLAARVEESVASYPSEAFWRYVKHQEIEEVFTRDSSGPVFAGLGMEVSIGDQSVLTFQDVFFHCKR